MSNMSNVSLEYEPPQYYGLMGRAPFASTTIGALGSWVAVTLLAAVYAYADLYIKFVDKLSILILIAFAFAMGFAVLWVLRWAKVRNLVVAGLIAASSAVLALYVSWVVWESAIAARAGESLPAWWLFPQPHVVWEIARYLNGEGTFSMRNKPVNGGELWAFWAGEAATILGCTFVVPLSFLRKWAFCEECQSWCESSGPIARFAGGDDQQLRQRVERKDFDSLAALDLPDPGAEVFHAIELTSCRKCKLTNLLTVQRIKVGSANGERTEKAKPLVRHLWLDPQQAEAVRLIPQQILSRASVGTEAGVSTESPAAAMIDPPGQTVAGTPARYAASLGGLKAGEADDEGSDAAIGLTGDSAIRRDEPPSAPPPRPGV